MASNLCLTMCFLTLFFISFQLLKLISRAEQRGRSPDAGRAAESDHRAADGELTPWLCLKLMEAILREAVCPLEPAVFLYKVICLETDFEDSNPHRNTRTVDVCQLLPPDNLDKLLLYGCSLTKLSISQKNKSEK